MKKKNGLGDFIIKDLNNDSLKVADKIITVVNTYAAMMDGSRLSDEEKREIHKLCALNPKIMDLITDAFYEDGYNSFQIVINFTVYSFRRYTSNSILCTKKNT